MRTIDLTGEDPSLQDLLRLATEGNVILRTGDGKEFLLAEVDDFEHEVALTRQQGELMALLVLPARKPGTEFRSTDIGLSLGPLPGFSEGQNTMPRQALLNLVQVLLPTTLEERSKPERTFTLDQVRTALGLD